MIGNTNNLSIITFNINKNTFYLPLQNEVLKGVYRRQVVGQSIGMPAFEKKTSLLYYLVTHLFLDGFLSYHTQCTLAIALQTGMPKPDLDLPIDLSQGEITRENTQYCLHS